MQPSSKCAHFCSFTPCSRDTQRLAIWMARRVKIKVFISLARNFLIDSNVHEFFWETFQSSTYVISITFSAIWLDYSSFIYSSSCLIFFRLLILFIFFVIFPRYRWLNSKSISLLKNKFKRLEKFSEHCKININKP